MASMVNLLRVLGDAAIITLMRINILISGNYVSGDSVRRHAGWVKKKSKKRLIMIRKQNRLRVKKAKKDYHWCGCDRMMVSPGEKCKFCGKIASKGKRKFKKDVDLALDDVL